MLIAGTFLGLTILGGAAGLIYYQYQRSRINFQNVEALEKTDLSKSVNKLNKEEIQLIKEKLDYKKNVSSDLVKYTGAKLEKESFDLEYLHKIMRLLNMDLTKLNDAKKALEFIDINLLDNNNIKDVLNFSSYFNLLTEFEVQFDKSFLINKMRPNSNNKTGMYFLSRNTQIKDFYANVELATKNLNVTKKYSKTIFDLLLKLEFEKIFLEQKFETKNFEDYLNGYKVLNLLTSLPEDIVKNSLKIKDVSSWLKTWDAELNKESVSIENKLDFISMDIFKYYTLNLETKTNIENLIVEKIKSNNWTPMFLNKVLDYFGVDFLQRNNLAEVVKQKINKILENKNLVVFKTEDKNYFYGFVLSKNLGIDVDMDKMWKTVEKKFEELKEVSYDLVDYPHEEWYNLTLLFTKYFKDRFSNWDSLTKNLKALIDHFEDNPAFLSSFMKSLNQINKANVGANTIVSNKTLERIKKYKSDVEYSSILQPISTVLIDMMDLYLSTTRKKVLKPKIYEALTSLQSDDGGFVDYYIFTKEKTANIKNTFHVVSFIKKFVSKFELFKHTTINQGLMKFIEYKNFSNRLKSVKTLEDYYYLLSIREMILDINN